MYLYQTINKYQNLITMKKGLLLAFIFFSFVLKAQDLTEIEWLYMTPGKFRERIDKVPVAYLPLGTLEWHGPHNPLGADALQPIGFFRDLASRVGGVVMPPLFLGPDRKAKVIDGQFYAGMDMLDKNFQEIEPTKLDGSAYYIEDGLFNLMIERIAENVGRQGIRILVTVGHGPSTTALSNMTETIWEKHKVKIVTVHNTYPGEDSQINEKYPFQADHAAKNETSILMYYNPETVHPEFLNNEYPKGVGGTDPRESSKEFAGEIISHQLDRMEKLIQRMLTEMNK